MNGFFVISLDFELLYGMEDKDYWESYKTNVLNGRSAIKKILDLFDKHHIHASWAIVGMMMNEAHSEFVNNLPLNKPIYNNTKAIYDYLNRIGKDEEDDPYHFGNKLIDMITKIDGQEIASHTYSHYYCNDANNNEVAFLEDTKLFNKLLLEKHNLKPKSIVFPKNETNDECLKILKENGYIAYRGNSNDFLYKNSKENFFLKLFRFIDAYTGLFGKKCFKLEKDSFGLVNVKSSMFFRPFQKKLPFLERFKINTIKRQMTISAKKGKVFHLWWHPHNFGLNTNENLKELEEILNHYDYLNNKYGYLSVSINDVASKFNEGGNI